MDGNLNTQVSDVRNKCSYFSFFFSIRQFHHYTIFYIYICNYLFFWKSVYSWIKINLIYVAKYWMLKKMSSVELMLCSVLWNWTKEPAGIEINMVIDEHSVHNIPFQRNKIDVKWPTVLIKTEPISGWLLYRRHFPLKIKNITKRDKTKLWICGEAPTLRENFKFGRFPDSCSFQQTQHLLKGQSNQNFDLQFFLSFEPAWATDQWPMG